ncbi:MAG: hypothetical protein AABY07_04000 [Nanoarchaeota archaeon]
MLVLERSVLERYAELLQNAGEDLSNIVSQIKYSDIYEAPIVAHTLKHGFNKRDYVRILLTENGIIDNNPNFKQIPFLQRSLVKNTQIGTNNYRLNLTFAYEGIMLIDQASVIFDSLGKIMPLDKKEDKQKTSFEIEKDIIETDFSLLAKKFIGIDTSVGADFEPVAEVLIGLYKNIKLNPKDYRDKVTHEKFEASRVGL